MLAMVLFTISTKLTSIAYVTFKASTNVVFLWWKLHVKHRMIEYHCDRNRREKIVVGIIGFKFLKHSIAPEICYHMCHLLLFSNSDAKENLFFSSPCKSFAFSIHVYVFLLTKILE